MGSVRGPDQGDAGNQLNRQSPSAPGKKRVNIGSPQTNVPSCHSEKLPSGSTAHDD